MNAYLAELSSLEPFEQLQNPSKLPKKPKHRFPLLKLPRLVLLNCIENLDVLEIILFSLLSKRAKSVSKHIARSDLDIRLRMTYLNQIGLRFPSVPNREWIVDYNRKKNFIPEFAFDVFGPKVNHYLVLKDSGNVIEDMKQMVEHICEVFRSPICGIDIVEESLIEWITNFQPTIRYACIRNEVVTSVENLDCIMKSLKVTEHFVLESIGTDKEIRSTEPISYRSISIFSSYWLTLPAILNGTNSIIRLYDSKLTPKDINTILKEWQRGYKLCNLEYLQIQAYTLPDLDSYAEVLEDLNLTESDGNDGRPMTVKIHDEWTYRLPEVERVQNLIRDDGMIGSIFPSVTVNEENGEIIDVFFNFQVWTKQA